jgi:putative PIN family toxin of toxin-antitoxin system
MRVVLDTNILTRVPASPHGPAGELFDRLRSDHLLVNSSELLAELARVLGYDRLRKIHGLDDAAIEDFVEHVEAGSFLVALPDSLPRVVPDDADDDAVIATAIVGHANVICTRNRHLFHVDVLVCCREHEIRVLSDVELLAELRSG